MYYITVHNESDSEYIGMTEMYHVTAHEESNSVHVGMS